MDLYLVRHGETRANAQHVYQKPSEPLSAKGASEVARLVHEIEALAPTHLYTSDFKRARETAHFFGYATKLEPIWSPLIHELYPPDSMHGKSHYGLKSFLYVWAWFFNTLKKEHERVETRHDFVSRVIAARTFFEEHEPEARVVAVTHSIFTSFFVIHLCRDHAIGLREAIPLLFKILRYENSGVTHMRYHHDAKPGVCAWEVIEFNGHDHLDL